MVLDGEVRLATTTTGAAAGVKPVTASRRWYRLEGGELRYAALVAMDDRAIRLVVDGAPMTVDAALLERFWSGNAHVFWRDFEGLRVTLGQGARGAHVARLQDLLRRAHVYQGEQSGDFDAPTAAAVTQFQRSRMLVPDARVGRLTRIVLYAAAGGYARPALGSPPS